MLKSALISILISCALAPGQSRSTSCPGGVPGPGPYVPPQASPEVIFARRQTDLKQLAAQFERNYGPTEWKNKFLKSPDILAVSPQLIEDLRHLSDDIDFAEFMVDWVARLKDAHVRMEFPSTFQADLGIETDLFAEKVLITHVNQSRFSNAVTSGARIYSNDFKLNVGDEIVLFGDLPARFAARELLRYHPGGTERHAQRRAVQRLSLRDQKYIPSASRVGDEIRIGVIREGQSETTCGYLLWEKSGVPLAYDKKGATAPIAQASANVAPTLEERAVALVGPVKPLATPDQIVETDWLKNAPGFTRLGCGRVFFCGQATTASGSRIGYIRIPTFEVSNPDLVTDTEEVSAFGAAYQTIFAPITPDETNPGVQLLVIDLMGNGGGSVYYAYRIAQIISNGFEPVGFQLRSSASWVESFDLTIQKGKDKLPGWVLTSLANNRSTVLEAYQEGFGRTGPLPLNHEAANCHMTVERETCDAILPRIKVVVLVDEMSASAAEWFAKTVQLNGLGKVAGVTTAGAGGTVRSYQASTYTEAKVQVTESLMSRMSLKAYEEDGQKYEDGLRKEDLIENLGVQPDEGFWIDYMVPENLTGNGVRFRTELFEILDRYLRGEIQ